MHIKNILKPISILAILAAMPAMASAQSTQFGAGASFGTTGFSVEGKYKVSDYVTVRGAYNFLELDQDEAYDGIDYDGTVEFSTFGGFADIHPFQNGFALIGGGFLGDKSIELTATPTNNVEIGGEIFTPEEVGDLDSSVSFGDFAAFAGLGFDNFGYTTSAVSFNLRAGVMFMDEPEADLVSTNGELSGNAAFQAELAAEEAILESEIEDLRYYPVLSAGIAYQF